MRDLNSDSDRGFGLVEIVVSMFVLALLVLSFAPLAVSSTKLAGRSAALTTAAALADGRLTAIRERGASCSTISALGAETSESSLGQLRVTSAPAACPTSFPSTVRVKVEVIVVPTAEVLTTVDTLVSVTG